jgi:hypothetical protein
MKLDCLIIKGFELSEHFKVENVISNEMFYHVSRNTQLFTGNPRNPISTYRIIEFVKHEFK